jgi:hypothetical protein
MLIRITYMHSGWLRPCEKTKCCSLNIISYSQNLLICSHKKDIFFPQHIILFPQVILYLFNMTHSLAIVQDTIDQHVHCGNDIIYIPVDIYISSLCSCFQFVLEIFIGMTILFKTKCCSLNIISYSQNLLICSHKKDIFFPQHIILFPQYIILFPQHMILFHSKIFIQRP